jgi:hypothetical protein
MRRQSAPQRITSTTGVRAATDRRRRKTDAGTASQIVAEGPIAGRRPKQVKSR